MKQLKPISILFFLFCIFFIACKKEKHDGQQPGGADDSVDSLITIKSNFTEIDTLQDIYKSNKGYGYYLYGKRQADGKITKVTGMAIKKKNSPDTVLNILYNDSLKVSEYYFVVNGIKDTALISFGYVKDSIDVCQYKINWATGERLTRYKIKVKQIGTDSIVPVNSMIYGRVHDTKDFFTDALAMIGGFVALHVGLVVTSTVSGVLFGIAGAGAATFSVPAAVIGFIAGAVIYALVPDAKASEITSTPLGSPDNPSSLFNQLKTVKDLFTLHTWRYESRMDNGVSDLSPCDLDDFFTFGANGTLTENTNVNQCFFGEPNIYTYGWSLYNNDQGLRIADPTGGYLNLTITKLTLDRIELSGYDDLGESWQYVFKTF